MAMTRQERSAQINKLLAGLTALPGVVAAAVIDRDGFVTHIRRDFEINVDALGAVAQILLGSARRASHSTVQGETSLMTIENKDGLIVLGPLSRGFVLAIMGDENAMLGTVRYEMKETIPDFNKGFGA